MYLEVNDPCFSLQCQPYNSKDLFANCAQSIHDLLREDGLIKYFNEMMIIKYLAYHIGNVSTKTCASSNIA